MGWVTKAPATANASRIYGLYEYGGELYIGTGPNARLNKLSGSSMIELTISNSYGGVNYIDSIGYSSERGYILVSAGARITHYDPIAGDLDTASVPTIGFRGQFRDRVGTGKVLFGGSAVNPGSYRIYQTDTDYSTQTVSQDIGNILTYTLIFNGKVYVASELGGLWEWNEVNLLLQRAANLGESIRRMVEFNSKIYAITDAGKLYESDGASNWVLRAPTTSGKTDLRGLCVHGGEIYATTGDAWLLKWNGIDAWAAVYNTSETFSIDTIISFGGELLGGGQFYGDLYKFTGISTLTITPVSIIDADAYGTPLVRNTTQPVSTIPFVSSPSKQGDIRLMWNPEDMYAEIVLGDRDVDRDGGFETAVLITLGTDKRASSEDELPDSDNIYKGGWWGDSLPPVPGYLMGTKLWLLQRAKTTDEIPALAEEYLRDGFQWMLDDEIIESFDVTVERVDFNHASVLSFDLSFNRPRGDTIFYKFYYNWETQILRRR